jgi:hypothetical protein
VRIFITRDLLIGSNPPKTDHGNFREMISRPEVSDHFNNADEESLQLPSAIMKETKRISHREK